MSKTSPADIRKIRQFFERLCRAHGWERPGGNPLGDDEEFRAAKRFHSSNPPGVLELRLTLRRLPEGSLAVKGMYFSVVSELNGGEKIMPTDYFLEYWGKRVSADPRIRKPSDGELWLISAPKDLDAFFEGYDHLAKRLGYQTLFE
ncbi:hypothetical protein A3E46_00210 [Candidatus Woesebacteria bacterium RIFCSPHIGHO2_12_FULL_46_16]|uniref:Uncharacterized protein n=1 Tax=Candidatus Woesebacteria bacterium RIFCSPHIGHO2_12_FULL_46_16 TaxID=1802513 RepID=A0A1F8AZ22_9BACT|nr:MAG: hypothetical protein A3E46_00210 [Candidatus Woesebacteria bacterium RIFCSPHIGHO2_12_FULL_46_16]